MFSLPTRLGETSVIVEMKNDLHNHRMRFEMGFLQKQQPTFLYSRQARLHARVLLPALGQQPEAC